MKRVIFGIFTLWGLYTGNLVAAQTGRTSRLQPVPSMEQNAAQTDLRHKMSASTRQFLLDWKECRMAAAQAGQSPTKSAQGSAVQTPADARLTKLQDNFGLQRLPAANTTANPAAKAQNPTAAYYVPVFVEFESEEALQEAARHGLIVQNKLKTIATALILADSLEAVAGITKINRIEVAAKVETNLDTAQMVSRAHEVQLGGVRYGQRPDQVSQPYKGEGVVVGIVDVGFDFTHPAFFDADNLTTYRVKRVWDQRATANSALKPPTDKNYGVEYVGTEAILAAQHCAGTGSHGSHVAGIAGGSGGGTSFVGMAPKSDLVFVPTTMFSTGILDAIVYILNYAKEQKKPCVVNLSLGSHVGPHDGTSVFDRACDELKQDGFVLVDSAGNEGKRALYLQHTFTANSDDTVVMSYLDFSSTSTALDIWGDSTEHFTAQLRLTDGDGTPKSVISVSSNLHPTEYQYLVAGQDTLCKVYCWSALNAINHKTDIYFNIDAEKWNKFKTGENKLYADYKLNVRVVSQNKQHTTSAQMWLNNGNFTKGGFTDPRLKEGSNSHTVGETGGTGKSIISVGAYESRMWWKSIDNKSYRYPDDVMGEIAGFSSRGPTADGRMKPDITAPGCVLISAYNSFDNSQSNQMKVKAVQKNNKDYHFGVMQGTSMSAPAAAGIIALWLQVDSTLDVDDVKQILQNTALPHPNAGEPNAEYTWGYGKIDAAAGVQYLLKKTLPHEPEPFRIHTDSVDFIKDSCAFLYLWHTANTGHNFGFYYHTTSNVKEGWSVPAVVVSGHSTCVATICNLLPNTLYHYKAFGLQTVNNQVDTVWGETRSFKTLPLMRHLSINTWNPQNITDTSATLYLSINGYEASSFGFFYHTQANVKSGKRVAAVRDNDRGENVYKADIRQLEPNRSYFCKAFGVMEGDTVYGETVSFKAQGKRTDTLWILTDTVVFIKDSCVLLYLGHTADTGHNFGFYYHTTSNVKAGWSVPAVEMRGCSTCVATICNLLPDTTYYYKAFGLQTKDNKTDTVWGETMSFRTLKKKVDTTPVNPPPVPELVISTEEPKNITDSSATLYLSIDKGESDTLGFFYHTQSDVLNGKHVCAAFDMGSVYMAAVQDLEANRYYFVKAYGVENGDTVYGKLRMFQTLKQPEKPNKPDSLAIEEALTVGRLLVYPNPVAKEGEFVVELPLEAGLGGAGSASGVGAVSGSGLNASASASGAAAYVLTITSLSGKTIQTLSMTQRQVVVRGLSSGVYLLQVESRKGGAEAAKIYQAKVVVQ